MSSQTAQRPTIASSPSTGQDDDGYTITQNYSPYYGNFLACCGFLASIPLLSLLPTTIVMLCVDQNPNNFWQKVWWANSLTFITVALGSGIVLFLAFLCVLIHRCSNCVLNRRITDIVTCVALLILSGGVAFLFTIGAIEIPNPWGIWHELPIDTSCTTRVNEQQAFLFTRDIYGSQFADNFFVNTSTGISGFRPFNASLVETIRQNQTLCGVGFQGNSDLYGIGIRIGFYAQWLASLCANHLLPENAKELQKIYLLVSVAICTATLLLSVQKTCMFATEIEVLHWMFWGGSVCVFFSAPNSSKPDPEESWVRLNWIKVVQFCTHSIMIYHGVWFIYYAYDHVFTRLPCGTYHFVFAKILDPSLIFWNVRGFLTSIVFVLTAPVLIACPFSIFVFANETICAMREGIKSPVPITNQDIHHGLLAQEIDGTRLPQGSTLNWILQHLRLLLGASRQLFNGPSHSQAAIRLITPIDVKNRRDYRVLLAVIGTATWVCSITAIELTLKWNRITGIHSLASVGQYMAFIVGGGSFVQVFWRLWRLYSKVQERRQEDMELQSTTSDNNTLLDVLNQAFQQADAEFLINGGVRPPTSWADEDEERSSISSSIRPSVDSFRSANDHVVSDGSSTVQRLDMPSEHDLMMSGALRSQ